MTYEVGKHYIFNVKGLGNNRLYLEDKEGGEFTVYAYEYQTEWDWSSPQVPAGQIKCYVKGKSANGHLVLEQSKDLLFSILYPEASRNETKSYRFIIDSLKSINETLFYIVSDPYGVKHLYKPSEAQNKLQPGDEIDLLVKAIRIKDNNKSHLVFNEITPEQASTSIPKNSIEEAEEIPIGEFGEENDNIEFKSTIVYPAGAAKADMDTQMNIILKTIAGFLNAKGGTLYIGVNDNGDAIGIEQEYHLLNLSTTDKFTYKANKDGYENKLRSCINTFLGQIAQDYITIKFTTHNNHTVCSIIIEPSQSVIWFKGHTAYKRIGNRSSHLYSSAIEKLILDKYNYQRPLSINVKPTPVTNEDEIIPSDSIIEETTDNRPEIIKATRPETIKSIGEEKIGKGSFYMNIFTNGGWSWSKNKLTDNDLAFCIPINNPASSNDLIIVYEDGCVNRVDAYHLHLKKKENVRYDKECRNDGTKIAKVFHAKDDDLLACFCNQNGHEFIKVHKVSHISSKTNMALKGNRLINTTSIGDITDARIYFIAAEHSQRVSAFIKTENQKSNSLGIQMDLPKNAKYLHVKDTLEVLCDIPSQM